MMTPRLAAWDQSGPVMIVADQVQVPVAQPESGSEELVALHQVLESGWWTGGKEVSAFEDDLCSVTGAAHAVALSSGTAAIYALLDALNCTGPDSLVVTSSLNFAAVPASARRLGAEIALTDVDAATLNMSPGSLESLLNDVRARFRSVIVVPVHYAGLPADMPALRAVAHRFDAVLAEDACHVMGTRYTGSQHRVGSWPGSAGAVFSFHPNKPVAAGEGGAFVTHDAELASRVRLLRNHSLTRETVDSGHDGGRGPWYYEIHQPGMNFRMSEFHAAVARVQLGRNQASRSRRTAVVERYDELVDGLDWCARIHRDGNSESSHHLYPVVIDLEQLGTDKTAVFRYFAGRGIGVQMHYVPLHKQPFCTRSQWVTRYSYPVLDSVEKGLLSLPLFSHITVPQVDAVCSALEALPESLLDFS